MAQQRWLYGKAVANGVPRFLSVSRLSGADEREGGCLRAWGYEMVLGKKRPQTRASKRGDDSHEEIEKYLKTGDRSLSSLVLSGMHMIPEPIKYDESGRPDMLVEQDMLQLPGEPWPGEGLDLARPDQLKIAEARAAESLARAPLTVDGIPVLGRMDLVHWRGVNKGASDIEDAYDPPGTIEVCDWKTTGTPEWIKKPAQLPRLIQMAGYAEWVYRVEPRADSVRLSHGYFVERGGPSRKVSLRVIRDQVAETWNHAEQVARSIRHAAAEPDIDRVPANLGACERYGGCTHREYCKARMHAALSSFVGQTAADKIITSGRSDTGESMGLLDKMKQASATPASPAPPIPAPPVAPASPNVTLNLAGAIGGTAIDKDAEKKRLEAEEKSMRMAAMLREAADKLRPTLEKLDAYAAANPELGIPTVIGEAAIAAAAVRGMERPVGGKLPGTGKLAGQEASTIIELESLAAQFDQACAAGAVKPIAAAKPPIPTTKPAVGLLSPETPDPTTTAITMVPSTTPVTVTIAGAPDVIISGGTFTAEAARAAGTDAITIVTTPAPTDEPKPDESPKKGSKKKFKEPTAESLTIYVDCFVDGITTQNLKPTMQRWLDELVAQTGDADVRCPQKDSPLAFNKWEGAVSAVAREKAESENLLGAYVLHTRGNRALECMAEALADRCRRTGGAIVWGAR